MIKKVHGTVRGNTIEVIEDLGFVDGEIVELTVSLTVNPSWGEGLRRCAGALADIPGLDEDMDQILRERNAATFRDMA